MKEIWKSITGFESFYEVSNTGQIRGLDRRVPYRIPGYTRQVKGQILKPALDGYGYPFVILQKHGMKKTKKVHQLVAQEFIGPCPQGHQINHKNGIKDDNKVNNLEYVTQQQNVIHSIKVLGNYRHGEHHWHSKVTEEDVKTIRVLYTTGNYTQQQLADRYGIHRGQIAKICNKTSWSHV